MLARSDTIIKWILYALAGLVWAVVQAAVLQRFTFWDVIPFLYPLIAAIPFCSHHNSQPRFSRQYGMIYRDRIISQRHGSSTETKLVQIANRTIQPCPWNQEHRTHRHPYRTAIQRIARIACQQNSIYPKSSCRTEYRPDIGSVHHTVNDYNPPGIPADLFHRGQHRTTHST